MSEVNILGIDLGNTEVKNDLGQKFESKVKIGITSMNKEDIQVSYNGRNYTLGTNDGILNISENKHMKLNYKLCMLTAIAKSIKEDNISCKVVTGVPVEKFEIKELVESIKAEILTYQDEVITINGHKKIITVQDAEVFCESGIPYSNQVRFAKERTLVIDLGGSTIDISLWNGLRQERCKTYRQGMLTLFEDIIKSINVTFGSNLKPYESKSMIGKSVYSINQEIKNIEFINADIENYMIGLLSYINQYFTEADSCDSIQLIGGGAIILEKYFKEEYKRAELFPNAEFANAYTYRKIGEMIWE